jgi:hypothetical protein
MGAPRDNRAAIGAAMPRHPSSEPVGCRNGCAVSLPPSEMAPLGVADVGRRRRGLWRLFAGTWNFHTLPLWLAAPLAALTLAWHGSLQHETIHGHPTRLKCVNTAIGSVPLALWLPYTLYRDSHLRHHAEARNLTLPARDPESHYHVARERGSMRMVDRTVMRANCTLAGRLILGPAITMLRVWAREFRRPVDRRQAGVLLHHVIWVAVVLGWVIGVCGISLPFYLGAAVYPSVSLAQLRSFAEHRAAPDPRHSTAIVRAHPFWALLFLNNQLHLVLWGVSRDRSKIPVPAIYRDRAPGTELGMTTVAAVARSDNVAALPMYDLPHLRAANNALWRAIAARLTAGGIQDVPPELSRGIPVAGLWRHPSLLLAQSCGYPLVTSLRNALKVVATPRYGAQGCQGTSYRSAIVVSTKSAAATLDDLRGSRCAAKDPTSNSGMNLLRALLIDGFDVLALDDYQNVTELERRAATLGYPELA